MGKNYKSTEAYVMQELQQAHETIETQKHHIETLETDLHYFNEWIVDIKKQFKVMLSSSRDDRYIVVFKDTNTESSYRNNEILAWESNHKEFFDYMVKLLGLEVPELPEKEMVEATNNGLADAPF